MENYINLDLAMRRMYCRATGVWDRPRAYTFRARMIEICDAMVRSGHAFQVLTDLTGLAPHSQDIAPIIADGAGQLCRVSLDRYAMIVPMALMRLQVQRLHQGVNLRFFANAGDATSWLDWRENPVDILSPPHRIERTRSSMAHC